jgi:hypothetical protein
MARDTKTEKTEGVDRRKFFTLFGGATTAAIAAPLATSEAQASESPADQRKARYQPNSKNVQDFYRVNRY